MGVPIFSLVPILFFGVGIFVLARGLRVGNRIIGGNAGPSGASDVSSAAPSRVTLVFRLARQRGGVVTVSDVVSELDVDPGEAEGILDDLSDGVRVQMSVDDDGIVRYVFREFQG
jgi:hypothetical protein